MSPKHRNLFSRCSGENETQIFPKFNYLAEEKNCFVSWCVLTERKKIYLGFICQTWENKWFWGKVKQIWAKKNDKEWYRMTKLSIDVQFFIVLLRISKFKISIQNSFGHILGHLQWIPLSSSSLHNLSNLYTCKVDGWC